eukprot:scaffold41791_cov29-Tisochrysis_lutea.AAC.6
METMFASVASAVWAASIMARTCAFASARSDSMATSCSMASTSLRRASNLSELSTRARSRAFPSVSKRCASSCAGMQSMDSSKRIVSRAACRSECAAATRAANTNGSSARKSKLMR